MCHVSRVNVRHEWPIYLLGVLTQQWCRYKHHYHQNTEQKKRIISPLMSGISFGWNSVCKQRLKSDTASPLNIVCFYSGLMSETLQLLGSLALPAGWTRGNHLFSSPTYVPWWFSHRDGLRAQRKEWGQEGQLPYMPQEAERLMLPQHIFHAKFQCKLSFSVENLDLGKTPLSNGKLLSSKLFWPYSLNMPHEG